MSLNNAEIDLILQELELPGQSIQKIIQPDFRNLFLQLYQPHQAWWLRICLEHPRVRLHKTNAPPRAKRSHQRFESFLHARLRGGRIVSAEHLFQDRIVRLEILHNGELTKTYLRFWGTRSNIVVTDTSDTILDAFFRKPSQDIESGRIFLPSPPERFELRDVRPVPETMSFNDAIEEIYHQQERTLERERLETTCRRTLERRRDRLLARLAEIDRGRTQAADADQYQHYGELILAFLYRGKPGDTWLDVEDYARDNRPVRITLDPQASLPENAQAFFEKAAKARKNQAFLQDTAENLQRGIAEAEATLHELDQCEISRLRELAHHLEQTGKSNRATESTGPGLHFSSRGFQILVGRNARENDHLLRKSVRGNDWWLHTRDCPGGYVFIKGQKNRSVPLEVLLDAGNLAVFFSQARKNGQAHLYYTQVKYLRRAKDGPRGLVLPTQEKNLEIRLDQERLRALGIGSDLSSPGEP
ncbi:Fibronectin-binding protein A N-terminus (FbpA) [Alkalispirochaeta americana]|uniref:Fibronectin-binding protein A N-terminus (FbpA) n=1 Tax=Alkalispirochaeta americana TaxID=159291 RepID=A0A1N6NCM6_9SPIO|nr:NFACT family protein [Alkalispirochaeta americana]SIP89737.1 Fibronectin-binding protein A N-terminus (FbpA) [Alkalispirochaeta americana]